VPRRRSAPLVRQIRLGLEVPVRHDGERVIIDAPALGAEDEGFWHYRPLGDPPADGIVDGNVDLVKERRKASEAQVTVLDAQRSVVLGMPVANVDLHVRVERSRRSPTRLSSSGSTSRSTPRTSPRPEPRSSGSSGRTSRRGSASTGAPRRWPSRASISPPPKS
jgi:hypothetical protein